MIDLRIAILHDGKFYVRVEKEIGDVSYYGPYPNREQADDRLAQLKKDTSWTPPTQSG
jgi:hypothetical protein